MELSDWLPRGPYHTVRTSRVFAPKQVEERDLKLQCFLSKQNAKNDIKCIRTKANIARANFTTQTKTYQVQQSGFLSQILMKN